MRRSPENRTPSYVFVELKQWSHAHADPDDTSLVYVDAYGSRPLLHPAEQVTRYVDYTCDFTRALEGQPESVVGAAYLHNANDDGVASLRLRQETERGRMFTATERGEWLNFLASRLAPEPGRDSADLLLKSKIAPSRQLMALAADEIKSREQFVPLDEQQVAFRVVMNAGPSSERSQHQDGRHRDRRAGERQERDRAVDPRGAVPAGARGDSRDGVLSVHRHHAQGRGPSRQARAGTV